MSETCVTAVGQSEVDDLEVGTLDGLLDELEAAARNNHPAEKGDSRWVCQREWERYPFRSECTVRFLSPDSDDAEEITAQTRNLSHGGIGIIVRHVFQVDEPVEAEVTFPDRTRCFMAGVVRFCRYAGRGYHEIGVMFKVVSESPVFSDDPRVASDEYSWLTPVYMVRKSAIDRDSKS